jgi:hypothetical protein
MTNVVMFTDMPSADWFSRGYGAYRLANEIRQLDLTALTVDFASTLDWETFTTIIDKSVGPDTVMVGFSVTWFPYRHKKLPNPRYVVGFKSLGTTPGMDFDPAVHPWYYNSLAFSFSGGEINKYIEYIKNKNPKTKVVVGGAKAYEYVFEPNLDNIFVGYSENQMVDYLKALTGKGPKRIFNKIINYDVKAQNGSFDFNKSCTTYVDTDCLNSEEILTFEFSRGCIFNCAFCSYPHRNQDTRDYVKYQDVIRKNLIDNWEKWGSYKYVITDDTFNDYTEKLILINEVIQSLPFKPEFWAYVRLDLISRHPEQAQLLKDIGVKEVYYGLETWDDTCAKTIRKGGSRKKKIEGMRIAKECWGNSVYVTAGIVVGLPNDTVQSIEDSIVWYKEEGHKYVDLFGFGALALRDFGDAQDYIVKSDIEADMAGYGYVMPDPDNEPLEWKRKDSGDIISKTHADSLMKYGNSELGPFWNLTRVWDWTKIFASVGIDPTQNPTDMVYEYVSVHYWPKLLEKLK